MKILLLTNRFPPDIAGGAEILAGDVARGLRRRGHEVRVLTERFNGHSDRQEPWIDRTLRQIIETPDDQAGSLRTNLGRVIAFYRQTHCRFNGAQLGNAVGEWTPDLVFVWAISGIGLVSILHGLRDVRVPIVFHLHNYWWQYINSPQTRFSRVRIAWIKKLIIGSVPPLRFTSSIAVSDAVKNAYVRAGCPHDRIEVIGIAVDARFHGSAPAFVERSPRPVLMYAGRLCAEKGVMVALEAVNFLVTRDRRELLLWVYGAGDARYEGELRAYIRSHALEGVVTLKRHVDQEHLIDAYDRADVVLIPSLWEEPSPLVALEAMARGAPVIASDVGGMRALLDDTAGCLVTPGDPHALASTIANLLDSPAERRRIGEAGRHAVRERFTIEARGEQIERHLERALTLDLQESRWAG